MRTAGQIRRARGLLLIEVGLLLLLVCVVCCLLLACCRQEAPVVEDSELCLDGTINRDYADGHPHNTRLLLNPATLRGQQAATYLLSWSCALETDGKCAYKNKRSKGLITSPTRCVRLCFTA